MLLDDNPDLSHLVRLGLRALPLKVNFLRHPWLAKNMVASANTHFKPEVCQQTAKLFKTDIGIRQTAQYLKQQLFMLAHF